MQSQKIKSIKKLDNLSLDRYNLEVEDNNNYFANNILVHNCRCIAIKIETGVKLYSRMGKEFVGLTHIKEELAKLMADGDVFDGELYNHSIPFQELISLVKKDQPDSSKVEYHIYDTIRDGNFYSRFLRFTTDFGDNIFSENECKYLKLVKTTQIKSHKEVKDRQSEFIAEGYEGAILRTGDCLYKEGARSSDLLKVKNWMDAEFKIVDVVPGIGKMENQGMFICDVGNGETFKVRSVGEDSEREEYLANKRNYIGKMLTVKFFEYTDSETPMPRFPVGLRIRSEFE